ncbi:hypothetical protein RintRC_7181 [Richelia intracellularis]|nr:hypothetical protein RintRC_7181 [Richelia intracellularis]
MGKQVAPQNHTFHFFVFKKLHLSSFLLSIKAKGEWLFNYFNA